MPIASPACSAVAVSLVAAAVAVTSTVVAWFFYSGTAADVAQWLVIAAVAPLAWFMGWGGY